MFKVFLIAGLGADTRIYNNIEIQYGDIIPIDWIVPNSKNTLVTYAQKLIHQYHIEIGDVVIGNSLGGMIAIEIAKQVPLKKVILISSIKTIAEAPGYFKLFKALPVYALIPGKLLTGMGGFMRPVFGKMSPQDLWLFKNMLKRSSPVFMKWAMKAVLSWDNTVIPPNVVQIIGDKDLVFPYKKIKDAVVIKGGTHIMIFDRAKEINRILKKVLK